MSARHAQSGGGHGAGWWEVRTPKFKSPIPDTRITPLPEMAPGTRPPARHDWVNSQINKRTRPGFWPVSEISSKYRTCPVLLAGRSENGEIAYGVASASLNVGRGYRLRTSPDTNFNAAPAVMSMRLSPTTRVNSVVPSGSATSARTIGTSSKKLG